MRFPRLVLLLVLALLAGWSSAVAQQEEDPADTYFLGYRTFNEGERLLKPVDKDHPVPLSDLKRALDKFQQAQTIFDGVAKNHPTWQSDFVTMRRQRLANAIEDLKGRITSEAEKAATAAATPPPAPAIAASTPVVSSNPMPTGSTPIQIGPSLPQAPSTGDPLQDAFEQMKRALGAREAAFQQQATEAQAQVGRYALQADQMLQQRNEAVKQRDEFYVQATKLQDTVNKQQAKVTELEKKLASGDNVKGELEKARKELADSKEQMEETKKRQLDAEKAMMTKSQQLVEANMKLAAVEKERDENKTKVLGLQAENEALKRRGPVPENMKDLVAENDKLKKDLDDARKQIVTLKTDAAGKDKEIAQLKGQLTSIQGELTQLKKENAAYETQLADLTLELKKIRDLADDPKKAKPDDAPQLMAENQLLKSVILRQIRQQARQQQLKANVIAEIQKTENASKELLDQVEQLAGNRVKLSDEEQKLFTTPQLQEIMGADGIKATLMVKSDKPSTTKPADEDAKKKEAALNQLIVKGNELLQAQKFIEAAAAYDDVLRADPKNSTAFAGLASIRIQQNKLDDAEAVLKKSLAYEPNNSTAHYMLGMTLFKLKRLNEAQTAFEKSLSIEGKNARARHYLGVISSQMGISDRAEREFKSALAIDPAYGEADFNLAVVYATRTPPQWDLAKKHYADALKKGVKADSDMEKLLQGAK